MDVTVVKAGTLSFKATRHLGISSCRPIDPEQSPEQNVVFVDFVSGGKRELESTSVPESAYVISGVYELVLAGDVVRHLETGDLVHFPPGSSHGVRCVVPGRWLAIFTPV